MHAAYCRDICFEVVAGWQVSRQGYNCGSARYSYCNHHWFTCFKRPTNHGFTKDFRQQNQVSLSFSRTEGFQWPKGEDILRRRLGRLRDSEMLKEAEKVRPLKLKMDDNNLAPWASLFHGGSVLWPDGSSMIKESVNTPRVGNTWSCARFSKQLGWNQVRWTYPVGSPFQVLFLHCTRPTTVTSHWVVKAIHWGDNSISKQWKMNQIKGEVGYSVDSMNSLLERICNEYTYQHHPKDNY